MALSTRGRGAQLGPVRRHHQLPPAALPERDRDVDRDRLAVRRDRRPRHAAALLPPATSRTSPAIRLRFSAFRGLGALLSLEPRATDLWSITLVAYGKDHEAPVDLREIGFYGAAATQWWAGPRGGEH